MTLMTRSVSLETLTASAISVASPVIPAGHDDGLSHDHHWARDTVSARGAHPIVADRSGMATPSSVTHDDIHYA